MRTLEVLQEEVKSCTKCDLHKTRLNTVFARGNPKAKLCVLAEAPGQEEDQQGLPFVGKAGQLLDRTLIELGVDIKNDIYVINTLKCRPPNNRKPTEEEISCCFPFLEEQLEIVNPKVIMALGNTAIQALTNTTYGITKLHGQFLKYKHIPVLCGFHPSYVIRNGSGGPIHAAFKQDLANGHQPNKGRLKCLSIEYVISGILRATLSVALLPN